MTSETTAMHMHPDIMELRAKHDKFQLASESPIAQTVTGLLLLTGLYMAISPWVVGFTRFPALTVNNLILGVALAVLALGFASMYGRFHGIGWAAPAIGVWMIIAPWVIRGDVAHTATIWSNAAAGAVALVLGSGALFVAMRQAR